MSEQPVFFRVVSYLMGFVGLDAATSRGRLWTQEGASWMTARRLSDGVAMALGGREVVVSKR